MNINGWEFTPSAQYWSTARRNLYGAHDVLFENQLLDTAILIHSIVEARMLSYEGFLIILNCKKKPTIILQPKYPFKNKEVVFSSNGKYALSFPAIYANGWHIIIFDLIENHFSCIVQDTNNSSFNVQESGREAFSIVADKLQMESDDSLKKIHETEISLKELSWLPFNQIDIFCDQLRKRGAL